MVPLRFNVTDSESQSISLIDQLIHPRRFGSISVALSHSLLRLVSQTFLMVKHLIFFRAH